jgi:hypothetical protein
MWANDMPRRYERTFAGLWGRPSWANEAELAAAVAKIEDTIRRSQPAASWANSYRSLDSTGALARS